MQDQNSDFLPWIEKYRPASLDQLSSQEEVVSLLKRSVVGNQMPHLLFYGPPGTGKTSLILAYCKQIFKNEFKNRVMELNASDERGIQVIRDKIKNFCKIITSSNNRKDEKMPNYKIVILDEADMLTKDAQAALRRIIELYSNSTRFCLICNYVSKIILPIVSRCAKFRFKNIPVENGTQRLLFIANNEGMEMEQNEIELLFKHSNGDLRKAIQYMQSLKIFKDNKKITHQDILDIVGAIDPHIIDLYSQLIISNEKNKPKLISEKLATMINSGYSADKIIEQLHDKLLIDPNYFMDKTNSSQYILPKIAMCFAETDIAVSEGSDEFLQLLNLSLKISKICSDNGINSMA